MPVIKSAQKKLRQDKKRTESNDAVRENLKEVLKKARKSKNVKTINLAVKTLDKAAKNHVIHKNKAARLKSALSKLLPKTEKKAPTAPAKKASAKPQK